MFPVSICTKTQFYTCIIQFQYDQSTWRSLCSQAVKKVDLFRFEQEESTSGKVLKGTGTTLLAIWTLGLTEIIANPVTKKTDMVVFEVLYDEDERVETVNFIQLPKQKDLY